MELQRGNVNRKVLFKRDKGICGICNQPVKKFASTIDHIIPKSRGGLDTYENTQIAHFHCNTHKGNLLPDEMTHLVFKGPPNRKPRYRNRSGR